MGFTKLSKRNKLWLELAVLLLVVYVGLRVFEYKRVYYPLQRLIPWDGELGKTKQDIYFNSSDGVKLNGWFFPAATNSPRRQLAVVVCHGNGGNVSDLERLCHWLADARVNVLLFDYRGYGRSEGRPGEEGTYRDSQAAYQWLRAAGFAATNILVYGESLGGAMAAELALREPTGGLILESTYTSIPDLGVELYPWLPVRLVSTIKYDTRKKLPKIKVPVMVMHSRVDDLIPFHMAEDNFAVAKAPKLFWEIHGGHAGAGEECHVGVEKFLAALEKARAQGGEVKF
jgi:fermentation-respiration switch protein FrsA (DUF1100 family)